MAAGIVAVAGCSSPAASTAATSKPSKVQRVLYTRTEQGADASHVLNEAGYVLNCGGHVLNGAATSAAGRPGSSRCLTLDQTMRDA